MATAGDARGPGAERAWCEELPASGPVTLSDEESRHLVRVRRVRAGDAVVLFDGRGTASEGRLVRAEARGAVVEVLGPAPVRSPAVDLEVAVSLPEPAQADGLVGGLAELGVRGLTPLVSARTPPGRMERASRRLDRWRRIAVEAAKVNGSAHLLRVGSPEPLGAVLARGAGGVLLDPDPAAAPLAASVEGVRLVLVGPEGGFTSQEMDLAGRSGLLVRRLGGPALRSGTAALAAASLVLCR